MKNIIITVIIVVLLAFGGYYYFMYQELLDEQQQVHLYDQLVVNGQLMTRDNLIEDDHGRLLISVTAIQEAVDESVYLSGSKSRIYIPLVGKNFRLETNKLTQYVRQHVDTINIPIKVVEEKRYVELAVLSKLYGLQVIPYEAYNTVIVENRELPVLHGVSNKVKLLGDTDDGLKSVGKFQTQTLTFLSARPGFDFVLTDGGEIGYVKQGVYSPKEKVNYYVDQPLNKPRLDNTLSDNFILTWHQTGSFAKTADIGPQETLPIDVISPTFFELNVEGIVINEASYDYVQKAHDKGYDVWGLYSNSFKPEWTKELFNSADYSNQSIAQVLIYSALYDLDGINFDFENIYIGNKADYVTYIKNAVAQLQYQNVRTSLDVTVPWGSDQWSKVYDRKQLSKYVDYMCLMAYDEYWAASKKAGPVASMDWVERGITESLKLIPKEKLVLGIPLYMRNWTIKSNGNAKSKSMGWKSAAKVIDSYGDQMVYDEVSGQHFIDYRKEGIRYKLWVEDDFSIEKRMTMAKDYGLPGTAFWSKGFANENTWKVIENVR